MTAHVLVVAGTGSGVGKTSLTIGLARALSRRGLRVRAAKVGPDFLDPMHLALATGRPCLNLDPYMMGEAYVQRLVGEAVRDVDLLLIEGVMGLFDGAKPNSSDGSTAEVARLLGAPILLVADASGQARSFAAKVFGFVRMEPGLKFAGVIANRVGSAGHGELLDEALASMSLPRLVAAIPQGALPELKSRHLGLIAPSGGAALDVLADAVGATVPLEVIARLGQSLSVTCGPDIDGEGMTIRLKLAVAEDAAFGFIYADFRQKLTTIGVEWIACSPLIDSTVPVDADALFLPGGYPEEHAAELAANRPFLESLAQFAARRPVYAECGGLMLLGDALVDRQGVRYPMTGILPLSVRMGERAARLGYAEVTLGENTLWGRRGATCRGHEFHYSSLETEPPETLRRCYDVQYQKGDSRIEGYTKGRVLGSYVHLHLASRHDCLRTFVEELAR